MKRTVMFIGVSALILGGAGCGGGSSEPDRAAAPPASTTPPPAAAAIPMIVDGYQIVRVIVRDTGYEPDRFQLQAGTPAKVVFVQESSSHCASQVQMPDFGVSVTDLPVGKETIVEFSPAKAGTFAFTCGMDMMRGTIVVTS